MGVLICETLELIMQIIAEEIAQGKDPLYWIMGWAEMAEAYNEL